MAEWGALFIAAFESREKKSMRLMGKTRVCLQPMFLITLTTENYNQTFTKKASLHYFRIVFVRKQ